MANPKFQSAAIFVEPADLYWIPSRNCRTVLANDKRKKELAGDLKTGWNQMLGTVAAEEVGKLSTALGVDLVAQCVNERTQFWNALKANKDADGLIRLYVWERNYVKDGKVRPPKFIPNTCFQRGSVVFDAMVLAKKDGNDLTIMVPVAVREYASEGERLAEQLSENEKKTFGATPLEELDKVRATKRFYDLGSKENDVRKQFKSSNLAQKAFKLCILDSRFPNLHILDRLYRAPDQEGYIPFGTITVNDILLKVRQTSPNGADLKPGETAISEADLDQYFQDVKGQSTPRSTVMKPADMKAMTEQPPAEVVRECFKSASTGNVDNLARFVPVAPVLNVVPSLATLGVYPIMEPIILEAHKVAQANPGNLVAVLTAVMNTAEKLLKTI